MLKTSSLQNAASPKGKLSRFTTPMALGFAGLMLSGCNGAFWGNVVVLGVTVGIFFGTLSLGSAATSAAEASTTTRS